MCFKDKSKFYSKASYLQQKSPPVLHRPAWTSSSCSSDVGNRYCCEWEEDPNATGEHPLCSFKSGGSTFITKAWHQGPGIKKIEPYDFMMSTNVAGIIWEGKKKKQRGLFEEQSVLESQTQREKELIDDMHSACVCVGTFAASFEKLRYCCSLKPWPAVETTTSVNNILSFCHKGFRILLSERNKDSLFISPVSKKGIKA